MKSYKINNLVIEANSPVEAMKLSKIMSKVKDAKCNDKHYYWNDIRQLCIKNNWYTRGTNAEYDNMFRHAEDGSWNAEQIANDIYEHSSLETNYDEVLRQIKTLHLYDSTKDAEGYRINFRNVYENWQDKVVINADNAIEALKKFKEYVIREAMGTANINVISVSPNDGNMRLYGKLSELVKDSTNDSDIDELSDEERKAIEDYKEAIAKTKDVKLLKLFAHILKEETEHLEELQSGETKDSIKDAEQMVKHLRDIGIYKNDADVYYAEFTTRPAIYEPSRADDIIEQLKEVKKLFK